MEFDAAGLIAQTATQAVFNVGDVVSSCAPVFHNFGVQCGSMSVVYVLSWLETLLIHTSRSTMSVPSMCCERLKSFQQVLTVKILV